jgi:hypothetical protein
MPSPQASSELIRVAIINITLLIASTPCRFLGHVRPPLNISVTTLKFNPARLGGL